MKMIWNGPEFVAKVEQAADAALLAAAEVGASAARRSMPGRGAAVLRRKGKGNLYVPSDPGEPPGIRTGTLRRSIVAVRLGPLRAAYGTNIRYGKWLEFGTTKMRARPWLRPSLALARNRMARVFVRTLKADIASAASSTQEAKP